MKYYDLTLTISEDSVTWPGDVPFTRNEQVSSAIVSTLHLSSHLGTHIDAPRHFIFDAGGIDKIQPSQLVGKFKVLQLKSKKLIDESELKKLKINKGDKVLFKTHNSKLIKESKFTADYTSLSLEAANYLAKKGVHLVGTDYFGIEAKSAPGHPVHIELLKKKIVIVEGLNMSAIKPGTYSGAILPLKIKNADGAPARAILWR